MVNFFLSIARQKYSRKRALSYLHAVLSLIIRIQRPDHITKPAIVLWLSITLDNHSYLLDILQSQLFHSPSNNARLHHRPLVVNHI